jgi:hypothetical protein
MSAACFASLVAFPTAIPIPEPLSISISLPESPNEIKLVIGIFKILLKLIKPFNLLLFLGRIST